MKYDFKRLKEARIQRRLTQTELARRTGLSAMTISKIEAGRGPWIKAIREIEGVLGVNVIKARETA